MCFDNTFAKRDKIKNSTSLTLPSMTRTLGKGKYQGVSWTRYKLLLKDVWVKDGLQQQSADFSFDWHLFTDFTSTRKLRKSFLSMKFYSPHIKDEKINTGGVVTRGTLVDSHWGFLFHWNIFLLRLLHLAQPLLARFLMKTKVKQRQFRKQIIITVSSSSGRLATTSTAPRVVIVFLARELGFFLLQK